MQIKDGGWYKRHDGEIVGPAERFEHARWPWVIGAVFYADYGHCNDISDQRNLICEVPPPMDGYRPTGEFRVPVKGQDTHWFQETGLGWRLVSWLKGASPNGVQHDGKRWIAEKIPDEAEELTEADVESDGWIDWPGGECPVDGDVKVEVRFRDGSVSVPLEAGKLFWQEHELRGEFVAYRVVPSDQPAEPEKQPQPGEWWEAVIDGETVILWLFEIPGSGLRWVDFSDAVDAVDCGHVEFVRHLPDCTGFDYVPPPEQTPAEKRLDELGVGPASNEPTNYANQDDGYLIGADWTPDQLEAIAAHMREREGGAE